ncbi:MAG TPA: aminotransferase class I/II-fold pyridoxal phosphate-dependent enzyme [Actinomycetes bacterium]|jgi:GntR family transcriptional regulator/MocR family aminotransferase|nr:aminotransferase class I/II-fold pyridoxal phosphate-dependent enzyme [Actinomycetes bacterium]
MHLSRSVGPEGSGPTTGGDAGLDGPRPLSRVGLHLSLEGRRDLSRQGPRPVWDRITAPPDMANVHAEFDFRAGIPDARRFPFATWRALLADRLRPTAVHAAAHIDPAGQLGLRAAIARHIGVSRGVRATAEEVFVTNGSQQAIDLVARVLLEPGAVVAVEDPGCAAAWSPAPPMKGP